MLPSATEDIPTVRRPRGRPRGSGQKGTNGAAGRGRGQGRGRRRGAANGGGATVNGTQQMEETVEAAVSAAVNGDQDLAAVDAPEMPAPDIVARPRRASGKYEAGEAIVDTVPRRSPEEVNLAKKSAQKKTEEARAAAELQKLELRRQLALLEDDLQSHEIERIAQTRRPDLIDRKLEVIEVSEFACLYYESIDMSG